MGLFQIPFDPFFTFMLQLSRLICFLLFLLVLFMEATNSVWESENLFLNWISIEIRSNSENWRFQSSTIYFQKLFKSVYLKIGYISILSTMCKKWEFCCLKNKCNFFTKDALLCNTGKPWLVHHLISAILEIVRFL